ncbi:MAG: endo-1,4-beta-xylanase [Thermosynechococcaceae cyanobacterium]
MDRRRFIQLTGATTLVSLGSSVAAQPPIKDRIEIHAWTAVGIPMPSPILDQVYFLDLNDEPMPNLPRQVEDGRLWSQPPTQPFAIAFSLAVKGFGNMVLFADNQGRGYSPSDFPLNLNLACGRSRIHRVQQAINQWSGDYTTVRDQLQRASAKLRRAEAATDPQQMAGWANESLRDSLWAGERAALIQAEYNIAQQGSRPNFLWGCNFFGYPSAGPEYNRQFRELFNFATLPLYWKSFEPQRNQPNFATLDQSVNWLRQAGITPKGHPLVWFHEVGVPDWIKDLSYAQIRDLTRSRVRDITRYWGDRVPYYDIINEAHDIEWGNILNFSPEQMLEMTQVASTAAVEGYAEVQRIINICCAWSGYVVKTQSERPLQSAYRYLQTCLAQEIPFEMIGMQLYYPDQDMFEINRMLDRFGQLGKPVHITELGVSSATERDEDSYFKDPPGLWHGPWTETIQADWIEQFYTLCYSKLYIHAITWWDFADKGFWPHGGLLRRDMTPKESYWRLQTLRQRWSGLR